MTYAKKGRALIVALAMTLALASPTFALTSTASETLTVDAQVTLTGVPASISYGSGLGGTRTGAQFTVNATTNGAAGMTLTVAGSALTNGASTIAATNRSFDLAAYNCGPVNNNPSTLSGGGPHNVCTSGQTATVPITPKITVPPTQAPGAYTGTLTVTAVANP